ncbi:MAG: PAS domain-containing protein [Phycisphaerae bacterium]|nr:PAS domain-containing protein [Phycisphaerae bacterium]
MSGLWTSAWLSFVCARAEAPGTLGAGLEGAWWFSLTLGILWTWVCLVVVASVSGVLITWAIRLIRQRRAAAMETTVRESASFPGRPAGGAMVDTNHLVLRSLWQRVAWKDADGRYLGCTQSAAEALGLADPSQILGKTQRDFLPPGRADQAELLETSDQRVRQTGQAVTCLIVRTAADGHAEKEEILKLPVKDPKGNVIGIVETADSKVDAVCNTSHAVAQNADQPTRAVDSAPDAAGISREYCKMVIEDMVEGFALNEVIRDQDGHPTDYRILDVNPMFEEYVGLRREQVIGQRLSDLAETGLPAISAKLAAAVRENKPCQFRWRCHTTNRDLHFVSYSTRPDHVAMLVLDMTDQVRAEEESHRLQEQLHHTRKMEAIGQLAGGIAHDFNNLLTAIHGNAELIRIDGASTPSQLESAEQILKASQRMGDLTQQLLAFGRKGKLQTVAVDMHDAVAETVKLLSHSIDRRIEITQDLRAAYPAVMGDPSQLKNALLNLAINARDAMPTGGRLTFATRITRIGEDHVLRGAERMPPGHYLEVAVSDTGVGMDEETLERIFEPFFTTKRIGEGTGLGLAGVYGCMKNHKGFIDVQSQPGEGSTFRLYFPPAEANVGVYASDAALGPKAKHILVIDDEEMVRNYAVRALRTLGYRTSFCSDGEEAVRFYRDNYRQIDLVLLDLIMPRMGGLETFRELKAVNPNIRAVLISGYSDHRVIDQLRDEGVLGFVNKPFEIESLGKDLADYLEEDAQSPRSS